MVPSDPVEIQAAQIGAAATFQAALIQLATGALAIVGAIVGAIAVYRGATRQVLLQENAAKARAEAYRFKLLILVSELHLAAAVEFGEAKLQLDRYRAGGAEESLAATQFSIPEELTPDNWQDHAMLGIAAVRGIHELYEALKEAVRFNTEMRGNPWFEVSSQATIAQTEVLPDGSAIFTKDVAAEQHLGVAGDLLEAIKRLRAILTNGHEGRSTMEQKEAYETAVEMFRREHDRWVQNTLFAFGGLASVFVAGKEFPGYVPSWSIPALATLVSVITVFIALSVRGSTDAWREVVRQIERGEQNSRGPFELYEENLSKFSYWKDFQTTLSFWKWRSLISVTRMYTRLAIILAIFFACFTYQAFERGESPHSPAPQQAHTQPQPPVQAPSESPTAPTK